MPTDARHLLRWVPHLPGIRTVRTLVASRPSAMDGYVWGIAQHARIDLYAEDLGGGHTIGILLYAPDGRITSVFRHSAAELVATFRFTRP